LHPRVSNLASKRDLWQGRSRSGSIREYSLICSTISYNCGIFYPAFPLMCMYAFLYILCLCAMLCSQVINCFPHKNGRRFLGWCCRQGEISTSQCLEIRPSSMLPHPRRLLCLQTTDISTLVLCMRLSIAVSPLARRYASTVEASTQLPRVSTIHVYSSLTVI
jgi:hypothetical protein